MPGEVIPPWYRERRKPTRIQGDLETTTLYREQHSYSQQKRLPTGHSVLHRTQVSINQLTVILRDTVPPIIEVVKLGYAAVAVYSLLYQSAYQDQRYDFRKCVKRKDLKHCGGITNWSHKAIADTLGMGKAKVIVSIDLLLDNGFIQHEGFMSSSKGSKHRIYRVVYPEMIETVRAVMPILPSLPSETAKRLSKSRSFMCSAGDADWDPDSPDTSEWQIKTQALLFIYVLVNEWTNERSEWVKEWTDIF